MRFILIQALLFCSISPLFGQQPKKCGQLPLEKQYWEQMGKTEIRTWRNALNLTERLSRTTSDTDTIFVPVVVHVMHVPGHAINQLSNISNEQIRTQIEVLNEDFNKVAGTRGDNNSPVGGVGKIVFFLARLDPQGNPTSGINRVPYASSNFFNYLSQDIELKSLSMWPPTRYLNLWIVNSMISDVIGYAYLPETLVSDPTFREQADGVVVVAPCFGSIDKRKSFDPPFNIHPTLKYGRTATHEVGHYLNLYHTWGDMPDCTGTDFVEDTPPCSGPFFGCPTNPIVQCNNLTRMTENYLDYSDDGCMNIFTVDQIQRMRSAIRNYTFRSNMVSISNLVSTGFFINNQTPKDLIWTVSDTQSIRLGQFLDSLLVKVRNTQLDGISNWPVRFTLIEKPDFSRAQLDTVILTQSRGIAQFSGFKPDAPGLYQINASSQVPEGSPRTMFIEVAGVTSVFPNPFLERLFIKFDPKFPPTLIRLLDMSGKEMERMLPLKSGSSATLECGKLASGIYLLEINSANGMEVHKVMKE